MAGQVPFFGLHRAVRYRLSWGDKLANYSERKAA